MSSFARSVYDYSPQADSENSLSFSKGDIIQVTLRSNSGWWFGTLYKNNVNMEGWFPSNYVEEIEQTEELLMPIQLNETEVKAKNALLSLRECILGEPNIEALKGEITLLVEKVTAWVQTFANDKQAKVLIVNLLKDLIRLVKSFMNDLGNTEIMSKLNESIDQILSKIGSINADSDRMFSPSSTLDLNLSSMSIDEASSSNHTLSQHKVEVEEPPQTPIMNPQDLKLPEISLSYQNAKYDILTFFSDVILGSDDPSVKETFFTIYVLFLTPSQLASIFRYFFLKYENLHGKILGNFKDWIESNFVSQIERNVSGQIRSFIREDIEPLFPTRSKDLLICLSNRLNQTPKSVGSIPVLQGKDLSLFEEPVDKVAASLFHLEAAKFVSIEKFDIIAKFMNDNEVACNKHSINTLMRMSNKMVDWTVSSILDERDKSKRVLRLKFFIDLAYKCVEIRNFSSALSIAMGLGSQPILRLNSTIEQLNLKYTSRLTKLRKLADTSENFNNYRELTAITKPIIPFFGVVYANVCESLYRGKGSDLDFDRMKFAVEMLTSLVLNQQDVLGLNPSSDGKINYYFQDVLNRTYRREKFLEMASLLEPKKKRITQVLNDIGF